MTSKSTTRLTPIAVPPRIWETFSASRSTLVILLRNVRAIRDGPTIDYSSLTQITSSLIREGRSDDQSVFYLTSQHSSNTFFIGLPSNYAVTQYNVDVSVGVLVCTKVEHSD